MSSETEAAYWDGFMMGMSVPGVPWFARHYLGMDVPDTPLKDEWDPHSKDMEYIFKVDEPEDQAFWMGYVSGFAGTATFIGILYAASPVGFYSAGVHSLIQLSPVLAPVAGVVVLDILIDEMTTPGATVESYDVGGSTTYKVTPSLGGEGFFAWLFGW